MKQQLYDPKNVFDIILAIRLLREARSLLRKAGAGKAADYVQRSLKSAEGAERHAYLRKYANQRAGIA